MAKAVTMKKRKIRVMKSKWFVLILLLAGVAIAGPLPPAVKRPATLKSPKHSVQAKDAPMRVAGITQPPYLPMTPYFRVANSEYGTYELSAQALQPANYSLLFEVSQTLGEWAPLAYFGPQSSDQQSFVALYSYSQTLNIRASVSPAQPNGMMAVRSMGGEIGISPAFNGARAWSVKK